MEHGCSFEFFGAKANFCAKELKVAAVLHMHPGQGQGQESQGSRESVAGMVCQAWDHNIRPAKQLRLVRGWDSRGPVDAQDRAQAPRLFHHRCRGCDKSYVDSLAEPLPEVRFRRPLSMPRAAPLHFFLKDVLFNCVSPQHLLLMLCFQEEGRIEAEAMRIEGRQQDLPPPCAARGSSSSTTPSSLLPTT